MKNKTWCAKHGFHENLYSAFFPLLLTLKSIMKVIPSTPKSNLYSGKRGLEEMAKKKEDDKKEARKIRPATTPEARENQLIALAVDLAEKQLLEGTASSQVITHYLKLGSTKERIEREILEKQKDLIVAKTENLQSTKRIEELYENAINAMKNYSGQGNIGSEEEDDSYDD